MTGLGRATGLGRKVDPALLRLVNGVIWPGFTGLTAPDWLAGALESGLAGVVYFGHNIDQTDADQPARLSARLRDIRPEVLLGIDEEGGSVTRLEAATGSSLPGHAQLGRVDDPAATRLVGRLLARRAVAAGVNVVLAPVADVNTNPANPVIGVRSFGPDTALVSRHVAAMVTGLQESGVAACAKHFPGHGDTHTDSHLSLPSVDLSWAELERHHLPPFRAAIDAGVQAIMTAHIRVPERGDLPATLNPRILAALRDNGFTGTIVTDALDMAAVRASYGSGRGAVLALLAGADLLCTGNPSNLGPNGGRTSDLADYLEVRDALLDAVAEGVLRAETLERAGASVALLAASCTSTALEAPAAASAATTATAATTDAAPRLRADDDLAAARSARIVRAACRVRGPVALRHDDLALIDLRARPTSAVASTTEPFAAELERCYRVTRHPSASGAELEANLSGIPAENEVLVLVDRVASPGAQSEMLTAIAGIRPNAVVVNTGLLSPDDLPLAVIDCLAASRVTAAVVRAIVRGEA